MMIHATSYETKVWGETALVLQQPLFSVHHLRIRPHAWCSIHRHEHRINAFHVISGRLEVTLWQSTFGLGETLSPSETVCLLAGEGMRVPPRYWHRFATKDQPAEVLEIYFPVTPTDADIERRTEGGRLYERQ